MDQFSMVGGKYSDSIVTPSTENQSSCFGEANRETVDFGKLYFEDGGEGGEFPDNYLPS